ncbi:MAG: reverse transcriptase family protein, partial [Anaerovorax sp.]
MIETLRDFSEQLGAMKKIDDPHPSNRRYYYLLRFGTGGFVKRTSYTEVSIPKKNGETRRLHVPGYRLKYLQRYLLSFFSYGQISQHAFAYIKGTSLLHHAKKHKNSPMLVKLDIENFFDSISFGQVFYAIHQALSHCPQVSPNHTALSYHFTQFCTLEGSLPQGAPTSPMLSNLVFFHIDEALSAYCKARNITYTRYCDDLIFSGDFHPAGLIGFARRLLLKNGFTLHEKKTVIAGKGRQQKVTGILVNTRPQADKAYRRKIRQELYFIGKYGIDNHLDFLKRTAAIDQGYTEISYLQSLLGRICFVLQIDPANKEF